MAHISHVFSICVRQMVFHAVFFANQYNRAYNNGIANMQPIFQQYVGQPLLFGFGTHCYRYLRHSTNPRYSIPQINNYPTTTSGVQIIMTIIYACTVWAELTLVSLLTAFRAIRYGPTGQTLAASCIRRSKFDLVSIFTEKLLTSVHIGCKYYLLCITSYLGYPDLVEVDVSHLSGGILRSKRTVHGVSLSNTSKPTFEEQS